MGADHSAPFSFHEHRLAVLARRRIGARLTNRRHFSIFGGDSLDTSTAVTSRRSVRKPRRFRWRGYAGRHQTGAARCQATLEGCCSRCRATVTARRSCRPRRASSRGRLDDAPLIDDTSNLRGEPAIGTNYASINRRRVDESVTGGLAANIQPATLADSCFGAPGLATFGRRSSYANGRTTTNIPTSPRRLTGDASRDRRRATVVMIMSGSTDLVAANARF